MRTTEKRIAALESSADDGLRVVIVEDGETQAAALERLGLSDDRRVVYLTPLIRCCSRTD
jgi:hypothetical protein